MNNKKLTKLKFLFVSSILIAGFYFNVQNIKASVPIKDPGGCELNQTGHSCLPVHQTEYLVCHADGGTFCGAQ